MCLHTPQTQHQLSRCLGCCNSCFLHLYKNNKVKQLPLSLHLCSLFVTVKNINGNLDGKWPMGAIVCITLHHSGTMQMVQCPNVSTRQRHFIAVNNSIFSCCIVTLFAVIFLDGRAFFLGGKYTHIVTLVITYAELEQKLHCVCCQGCQPHFVTSVPTWQKGQPHRWSTVSMPCAPCHCHYAKL